MKLQYIQWTIFSHVWITLNLFLWFVVISEYLSVSKVLWLRYCVIYSWFCMLENWEKRNNSHKIYSTWTIPKWHSSHWGTYGWKRSTKFYELHIHNIVSNLLIFIVCNWMIFTLEFYIFKWIFTWFATYYILMCTISFSLFFVLLRIFVFHVLLVTSNNMWFCIGYFLGAVKSHIYIFSISA